MRKAMKIVRRILILLVGLLISAGLIYYSINKTNENEKFFKEDRIAFEENKEAEKKKCNENIGAIEQQIKTLEAEIQAIEQEITVLQRQQTEEFMRSGGWSDKYYALGDQITAKRNSQSSKRDEIFSKKKEITELESTIWEIDNDFGDYSYKQPKPEGISPGVTMGLGIIVAVITIFVSLISFLLGKVVGSSSYSEYSEISDSVLSEADITNGELLKKELYERVEKLLVASSKGDYEQVRNLCTKNMAKSYTDEMDLLKKHKQKRVIKGIENLGTKIINARKSSNNTTVTIVQKVKLFDYTTDSNNNVISGKKDKKEVQAFKLVFVKDQLRNSFVRKCFNCGAVIKDSSSVKCEYCGTLFDNANYDWYLVSKVVINED